MPQTILVETLASAEERARAKAAMKAVPENLRRAFEPVYAEPPAEVTFRGLKCLMCLRLLSESIRHWEACGVKWHPFPPEDD